MLSDNHFNTLPKIDAHNHLNLGMFPQSYMDWAGFRIPNFPRIFNGLDDMHEVIINYTRPRCVTAQDVKDLINLSVEAAISDNVALLEGSVDINFVHHFNENIDELISAIDNIVKKHKKQIDFKPELGMGKLFDFEKIKKWAPPLLESGIFKSIDLYGPEVEDNIENFKGIYKSAAKLGIKKKAHVGEFSNAASVKHFVEFFELDEVQHGIGAAKDDSVLQFLKERNVRLNVCPTSNVMLSAVPSLKEHPIRTLLDSGLRITVATDDLLFFNRTVGQQCVDLVNAGVITEQEAVKVMSER